MKVSQIQQMQQMFTDARVVGDVKESAKRQESHSVTSTNSSALTFELGPLKMTMHKHNETVLEDTQQVFTASSQTSKFAKIESAMKEEKKQSIEMSSAQKKVHNLFSPGTQKHIDLQG